ncbi:MAG: UDP-N-acetylmuramate dehydrogenase [Clostridia bacterium]|nr:UDP-N-acetylmuramate dehydrogenase [Clostridia bacterium]
MKVKQIIKESNIQELEKNILYNESMSKHTSFKIGGDAEVFIKATSIETIKQAIDIANKNNIPLHIIGNGSNVLVRDEGIQGIVLKPQLTDIDIKENASNEHQEDSQINNQANNKKGKSYIEVTAHSGVLMGTLAYMLMQNSITGFEELSGIPGTIGGAIRMNAGAHGKEIKDVVVETTYIDMLGNIHTLANQEQQFTYRGSIFAKEKYIILETKLKLAQGNQEEIKAKMEEYASWRKEHQPLEYPNAGSTFKRGSDFITAELIDKCGLKGYQIGGAQVSTKHAGFIVNTGGATAKDVLDLIDYVKAQVYKITGKLIELEIEIM